MLVPEEVRKCVGFVCFKNTGEELQLAGTFFFVSVHEVKVNKDAVYCVTARHVLAKIFENSVDKTVYLSLNANPDGKLKGFRPVVQTNYYEWKYHPSDSSADVAVFEWTPNLEEIDCKFIPETLILTPEIIIKESIGIGDEVFITGLFANHHGRTKNLPIVRVGNIALMSDPVEPVRTNDFGDIEAYLIEARSIGGISGSPVFVHIGGFRMVGSEPTIVPNRFYLMGLIHGHWDVLTDTSKDDINIDFPLSERMNMGVAITVPSTKILETIHQPELRERREEAVKAELAKRSALSSELDSADSLPQQGNDL